MKDSIANSKMLGIMFGILFVGSVMAMVEMYHGAKEAEHSLDYLSEEYDVDIFV